PSWSVYLRELFQAIEAFSTMSTFEVPVPWVSSSIDPMTTIAGGSYAVLASLDMHLPPCFVCPAEHYPLARPMASGIGCAPCRGGGVLGLRGQPHGLEQHPRAKVWPLGEPRVAQRLGVDHVRFDATAVPGLREAPRRPAPQDLVERRLGWALDGPLG